MMVKKQEGEERERSGMKGIGREKDNNGGDADSSYGCASDECLWKLLL